MNKTIVCKVSPVREKSRVPFQIGQNIETSDPTLEIIPNSAKCPYQMTVSKHEQLYLNHGDKIKSITGTTAIWLEYDSISRAYLLSPESNNSTDNKCRTELEISGTLKTVR